LQADEELQIRIFFDLLNQFIREPQGSLMIKPPSAIRKSFAGAPTPMLN
jgi:hypothetical protein